MQDFIIIKNLMFQYGNKKIFDKFNLTIKKGTWTSIIGPNGSGKSTLVKLLTGILKTYSYINIDQKILCRENIKEIRKIMGFAFENPDSQIVAETVMDDITFTLENLNYSKKEIRKRLKEISQYLKIEHLLELEPHSLSGGEKQLVQLASALIMKPKLLILDEAMTMIDPFEKENVLQILKKMQQETNMTILNVTHDMEDTLYGDDILLLQDGKIILKGPKELVLREEKIFHQVGLELPFMASLSIKLSYYGLIDELILDMDEMVKFLWK